MKMETNEISVLIQGAIDSVNTLKCIESIKKFLPESQIILSTWHVRGGVVEYNKIPDDVELFFETDPGYINLNALGNINRQIRGRLAGLKKCKNKYTLIIRSDSCIISLKFLEYFKKFPKENKEEYSFFKERVVICSAGNLCRVLFHICDWYFFGLTEDLILLYDIPLVCPDKICNPCLPEFRTPHEYLAIMFCRKFMNINYTYNDFKDKKWRDLWCKIIVENFICIGFYNYYGIINLKEPYYSNQIKNLQHFIPGVYHLINNFEIEDWMVLHNRYYHKEKYHRRVKWIFARIMDKIYSFYCRFRNIVKKLIKAVK